MRYFLLLFIFSASCAPCDYYTQQGYCVVDAHTVSGAAEASEIIDTIEKQFIAETDFLAAELAADGSTIQFINGGLGDDEGLYYIGSGDLAVDISGMIDNDEKLWQSSLVHELMHKYLYSRGIEGHPAKYFSPAPIDNSVERRIYNYFYNDIRN